MNINRHNYEEYFILYADNELSSDERRLVDEFVLSNPDLKDELDIYQNSILTADTSLSFENKESLLRYDESITSYIDDELPAAETIELEKLISGSPKLQQELELYRQTKLQPDTEISFGDKSVLYRSTERRVVPMRMIRWAAAAAILLAVSYTAVKFFTKQPNSASPGFAKTTPDNKNNEPVIKPAENVAVEKKDSKIETPIASDNTKQPEVEKQDNLVLVTDKQKKTQSKDIKQQNIKVTDEKNKEVIAFVKDPNSSNNLPSPQNNPNLKKNEAMPDLSPIKGEENVNGSISGNKNVTNSNAVPLYISNSTTINTPLNDDVEENKNKKSRGFFRKVTRLFEKNTGINATDDDKLRIAAFTVKLK